MEYLQYIWSHIDEILDQAREHLWLTSVSIILASIVGIFAGIIISRVKKLSGLLLGITSTIQTIPSLALLGFLLPIFGIGAVPAVIALFLYALLPIVRNTYTGIHDIDPSVKEAAIGMGLTDFQLLTKVELPLAAPVIFAGVRTAAVITVGIATLCALIGAGGLGELIFRGISLNNPKMIIAGAIPASLLALSIDGILALFQRYLSRISNKWLGVLSLILLIGGFLLLNKREEDKSKLIAGFNSEFIERSDGFIGLSQLYGFDIDIREMEIGLMYSALHEKEVDVIDGFSTDGRIKAYNLASLEDDKSFFPPYHAAPVVHQEVLNRYPEIREVFALLKDQISEEAMTKMNYEVDHKQRLPEEVAKEFLLNMGHPVQLELSKDNQSDITIGCKNFTESYILAHLFAQLIEYKTGLSVSLKTGFGGTKIIFDALTTRGIDLYPEYTGTGLLVLLQVDSLTIATLGQDRGKVYDYVKKEFASRHQLEWMPPLGFNNTFAMMMRRKQAEALKLKTISDLATYLNQQ